MRYLLIIATFWIAYQAFAPYHSVEWVEQVGSTTAMRREAFAYIRKHEGFKSEPYQCQAGVWTIGFGHAIRSHEAFGTIDRSKANEILRADWVYGEEFVRKSFPDLSGARLVAISHFCYAIGTSKWHKKGLWRALKQQRYADVPKELAKWCHYFDEDGTKHKSQVLSDMREWEVNMWQDG
jgi:lysozyme